MNRIHILLSVLSICLLFACSKDGAKPSLAKGTVFIQGITNKDTLIREVGIASDKYVVIGMKAELSGGISTSDHIINFSSDTTKLSAYRAKYGNATLLPSEAYFFFRSRCHIAAGTSVSDSIQLNLVAQTTLKPDMIYVLPISIQTVDGGTDAIAPNQIVYVVVKTAGRPGITKDKWRIVSVSNVYYSATVNYGGENLLDYDLGTNWATDTGLPMPQNAVIDFGEQLTFRSVTYTAPAGNYSGFNRGSYPTRVKIEVSQNGITWTDKGTFNGVTSPVRWVQDIGSTSTRYMRFTVLAIEQNATSPSGTLLIISDISVLP